jgi:hypothetical protein
MSDTVEPTRDALPMRAGTFDPAAARTDRLPTLAGAVATWTEPSRVKVLRDGGAATTAVLPSLLTRLDGATGSGRGRNSRGGNGSCSPVNLDVLDLLGRLRLEVAGWETRLAARVEGPRYAGGEVWRLLPLAERLRRLPTLPWPPGDDQRLAGVLARLADSADQLLAPADLPVWRLVRDTACPRCLYRVVVAVDEDGATVRVPTLMVEFDHAGHVLSVTCAVCWAGWWRTQLPELWDELEGARPALAHLDGARARRSGHDGKGGAWLADVLAEAIPDGLPA